MHRRLDERERAHRRRPLRRSRQGDAATEGMPYQVRAVLEELGDPAAVGLRIVGAAGVRAPPMPGAIGNDELPALLGQRPLRGEAALKREGGCLLARGLGPAPYVHVTEPGEPGFVALGLRAASVADVVALGRAEGVEPHALERPGGGVAATLRDPDGYVVEVLAGQTPSEPLPVPPSEGWNSARGRRGCAEPSAPARRRRTFGALGHCVLGVSDFRRSERWYKERFGLLTSDEIAVSPSCRCASCAATGATSPPTITASS